MRAIKALFIGHLAALAFGLGGLLIALPHPQLWQNSRYAVQVFEFGMRYAGSLHILCGAAIMLLFGLLVVGPRKTLIFFAAATTISLSMELLGTGTGFPFGAYSYSDFLGVKVLGRVPYSIPLSWFYMGFTSYILASAIAGRLGARRQAIWSVALGAYFLTVWDLALDPAMASQQLPIHFWYWHQTGPYFGMPIRNLVGWSATGVLFMSVSRTLWRRPIDLRGVVPWVPLGVYIANILFATALDLSSGLWLPPLMALALGIAPATLAVRPRPPAGQPAGGGASLAERMGMLTLRAGGRALASRNLRLSVEGLENVPRSGPVLVAARHYHHLYDGCALLTALPRPVRILVALDWAETRRVRRLMEWACATARWPVVLRGERLEAPGVRSAYAAAEGPRYLRHAVADSVGLLRQGELLVVFPEAYPVVDPVCTPTRNADDFLPFRTGFARIAQLAERDGRTHVAVVPAGLAFAHDGQGDRWRVALHFGAPLSLADFADVPALAAAVEQRVRALSGPVVEAASQLVEDPREAMSL